MANFLSRHNVNLSNSLVSWLNIPKRMMAKMHPVYGHGDPFMNTINRSVPQKDVLLEHRFSKQLERETIALAGLPTPFSFVTSSYALGLFITALLLNRIQHLVVPRPRAVYLHFRRRSRRPSLVRLWTLLLPADLSSTGVRLCFRLPSSYLLLRSLIIMGTLLAQSVDAMPSWRWAQALGTWVANKHMTDICWSTFCSVCIALAINQFTNGLEGISNGSSSINFFGYSFILHTYSLPFSHPKSNLSKDHLSRPDQHALVIMFLPLLQLSIVHLMDIRRAWSRQRLIPTTFCGLLGLAHFHYAVFFSSLPYPFANYLTSIVESILLVIIAMTVILNALTQLLLEGNIIRPLVGNGSLADTNLFGIHPSAMPSREDDFSLALLRLGTASFEATGVAGLQNEVTSVVRPFVTLDRAGVDTSEITSRRIGFENEITTVHAVAPVQDNLLSGDTHLQASKRFIFTFWLVLKNLVRSALESTTRLYNSWLQPQSPQVVNTSGDQESSETVSTDIYQVFLRGGLISDDEDDPYISEEEYCTELSSDGEDEEGRSAILEPMTLFTDLKELSTSTEPTRPSTPVLVAHLATSGPSPLTRRRFNAMRLSRHSESPTMDDWPSFITERRREALAKRRDQEPSIGYTCVICTVEPRDIICWPCRCLALCNDCRSNLASRSPAHKHACPCCRHSVQGFSRVFLP